MLSICTKTKMVSPCRNLGNLFASLHRSISDETLSQLVMTVMQCLMQRPVHPSRMEDG